MTPADISLIADEADLRQCYPSPMSRASDKVLDRLDLYCRAILAVSPFCVLSSQGPEGADISPRGDPPGFLRVLDDRHILLPDRIGNKRYPCRCKQHLPPARFFLCPKFAVRSQTTEI